jgi:hypothetical protein
MLLLLRIIILTFEYPSVLKSSIAQSLVLANTTDELLEHCTDAHGIKNRFSISKIPRWKYIPGSICRDLIYLHAYEDEC